MSRPTERRVFRRAAPKQDALVEVRIVGTKLAGTLLAADISEGGIGIRVARDVEPYDLDDEVDLVVTLPGARPFLARGRLRSRSVRSSGHVVGFEFTRISQEALARLSEYVTGMLLLGNGC